MFHGKIYFMKLQQVWKKSFKINLIVDEAIILEIGRLIEDNINNIGLSHPNVAKIAGQTAF